MGRTLVLSLAFCILWAVQAGTVVIATGDGSGNTTAPNDDPGWANVGYLGTGSGVYLGDRWVITAAHVGPGSITFPTGTFEPEPDSAVQLRNPASFSTSQLTDLAMFRLTADPGLPALPLSSTSPAIGSIVTMIGAGNSRSPTEAGWNRQQFGNTVTWTETPIHLSNTRGFNAAGANTMRWGFNLVSDFDQVITNSAGVGVVVITNPFFETSRTLYQAQAVSGDSGGAVFNYSGGKWLLAGIINSTSPLPSQPSNTAVFGDLTYSAQISQYRSQIVSIMNTPEFPWQNPTLAADVNNDGVVTALDALIIITPLNDPFIGPGALPPAPTKPPPFYDTNGDNFFSASDALVVINELNRPAQTSSSSFAVDVPEPSSLALASVALAGLSLLGWRRLAADRKPQATAVGLPELRRAASTRTSPWRPGP